MPNEIRAKRQARVDSGESWRFGEPSKLLWPIDDQESVWIAARTLPHHRASDAQKDAIKRRIISAARRMGLQIPKDWQGLAFGLNEKERDKKMSENKAAATLRAFADMCENEVNFADDEAEEVDAARRSAEAFAARVNAGLPHAAPVVKDVPKSTLKFIEMQNKRIRAQKEHPTRG